MGLLIQQSDFAGKYKISTNGFTDINPYIDKYEEQYLMELLGVDLFALFKANLDAQTPKQPQTPIYQTIYNKIAKDSSSSTFCYDYSMYGQYAYLFPTQNQIMISDGMKEMLVGFIYFEYLRDFKIKQTPSGAKVNISENAREAGPGESGIYQRYNEAIKSYHVIQWYILSNQTDYPKFNGIPKKLSYPL